MRIKKFLPLLCGLLLALTFLAGCSGDASAGGFSSFKAQTLDGETFTQKDIKNKDVTVINFWGTFCSPCLAEMPDLAAYAKSLPENVQLITICIDAVDDSLMQDAQNILAYAGYEGVTLIPGEDPSFMELLNSVQAVPTTVFVDSSGDIKGSVIGGQTDLAESFNEKVNEVLRASGKAEIGVAG